MGFLFGKVVDESSRLVASAFEAPWVSASLCCFVCFWFLLRFLYL